MAVDSVSQGLSAVVQDIQKERLAQARQREQVAGGVKKSGLKIEVEQQENQRVENRSASVREQVAASNAKKANKASEIKIAEESASERKSLRVSQAFEREAPIAQGRNQRLGSLVDISV